MELTTPRLHLREFSVDDLPAFREMDCIPEMHTYEREVPEEAETIKTLDGFIKHQLEVPRTIYELAVNLRPRGKARGIIKLSRQWEAIREWEVGWAISPELWGHGYAREAAWHIINWAFQELRVHRIVAFCHADNAASVRVMEKLGMHQDGRLRETRWLGGKWCDEYVYSILEKEWRVKTQELDPPG
jgi:[ribosomal protein S5]-alanine N-acetyltransferase